MMEKQKVIQALENCIGAYLVQIARLIDGTAVTKRWGNDNGK